MRLSSKVLMLALIGFAYADTTTYEEEFVREVIEFANLNRLNLARLHRDLHANCYIPVTISTVVLKDGSVRDVAIVESSTVPVVDRYFRFVISQAAPYAPLGKHFDATREEVTITHEFRLDVRLWSDGVSSTRPCEELEAQEDPSDQ